MENGFNKYLLGSNSCEGFVSGFSDCYDPFDGWRAYIIKGGPGTGKSSFMKHMAFRAHERGLKVDLCTCSSDPTSLDAILLPEIKTVFLDGTPPHVVEPRFAGACEEIINLGEFWNSEELHGKIEDIISVQAQNSLLHKTASVYLKAAGSLLSENYRRASEVTDAARTYAYAEALAKKNIPLKPVKKAKEWVRFIGAVTPLGIIAYPLTPLTCENRVIISDKYGSASGLILNTVRERALKSGYEIITLKNPFLPSVLIDHIMIPELSLCFLTENKYITFDTPERRIHSRRFINAQALRENRTRMRFCEKTADELLLAACSSLKKAKLSHDALEGIYKGAMDFEELTLFAEDFADNL